MTSSDRHAAHDSPYRTGQHMPLNQNRHAPLTSIATSAMDSRIDLTSNNLAENSANQFTPALPKENLTRPGTPSSMKASASAPYSPGLRSSLASQQQQRSSTEAASAEIPLPGEIQMQSFQDGLPPAPPVKHSWKKIDRWAEENYEELHDQLSEGATSNDVNELEHELDRSLPIEVRESLQIHDGQERGGRPTGIIFGCMLLDCEEIVQEWKNWRTVSEEYLNSPSGATFAQYSLPKAFGGPSSSTSMYPTTSSPSSSSPTLQRSTSTSINSSTPLWRQQLLERQDSQPPRAIQNVYAHPAWIPLARDWGGNNLAVDLAPGPTGRQGQVIIFGRDYDCKYVVARSWSAFLAKVADDLQSGKVFVDEETQELKLREFKAANVEPAYLDILRWRVDQRYGRRLPAKHQHSQQRRHMTSQGAAQVHGKSGPSSHSSPRQTMASSTSGIRESPYGSPNDDRGRSPQRVTSRGQQPILSSPVAALTRPSPLGRSSQIDSLPRIRTVDESQKDIHSTPTMNSTIGVSTKQSSISAGDINSQQTEHGDRNRRFPKQGSSEGNGAQDSVQNSSSMSTDDTAEGHADKLDSYNTNGIIVHDYALRDITNAGTDHDGGRIESQHSQGQHHQERGQVSSKADGTRIDEFSPAKSTAKRTSPAGLGVDLASDMEQVEL